MPEQQLKTALYVMGAFVIAAIGANIYLNSEIQNHKLRLEQQTQIIEGLKETLNKVEKQNEEALRYVSDYHGEDKARTDEYSRMKILLEGHDEKLYNIVKTINELH